MALKKVGSTTVVSSNSELLDELANFLYDAFMHSKEEKEEKRGQSSYGVKSSHMLISLYAFEEYS